MNLAIAAPTPKPQIAKQGDEVKDTQLMIAGGAMRGGANYRLSLGQPVYAYI